MDENAIITTEELVEFQVIVCREYGIKLTREQAFEQATALLNLVDYVLKKRLAAKRTLMPRNLQK